MKWHHLLMAERVNRQTLEVQGQGYLEIFPFAVLPLIIFRPVGL